MFLIIADIEDAFSARVASDIASKELKYDSIYYWQRTDIVSFALLMTPDGTAGQYDYIHQTRAIYMTPEMLRRQCELQPGLFEDEIDVIAETAMEIATMPFHNLIGLDVADMQEAFSCHGKVTTAFGQGNTVEDAVDNLLLTAEKIGVDLRHCDLAIFSMSGAPGRLSPYEMSEAPGLLAKKVGRGMEALYGEHVTLLSAPLDESLGDKLKFFAVFCEENEEKCYSECNSEKK